MVDLLKIFSSRASSKDIARERLKLVLIHDKANVSPQFLEMLKSEIMKVISNYLDIESDELDIQLTHTKSESTDGVVPALIANIPIKKMKNSGR